MKLSLSPTQSKPLRFAKLALFSALALGTVAMLPQTAQARVFVSVNIAPPALPVYEQPAIPGPGYIWTPGYWAYDDVDGYYWVPGTWILPPYTGALWTPGYWGWSDGAYAFHEGYWGLHVGFYGGIDYGFGYGGIGYVGGYWGPRGFYYNREVNHITNVNITNVYSRNVANTTTVSRASFNGPGGISARPTSQQLAFQRESHTPPIASQVEHRTLASHTESLRASVNHGAPAIAATATPNAFSGRTVAATRAGNPAESARSAAVVRQQGHAPQTSSTTANRVTRTTTPSTLRSAGYAHSSNAPASTVNRNTASRTTGNVASNRAALPSHATTPTHATAQTTTLHENSTSRSFNASHERSTTARSQTSRVATAPTHSENLHSTSASHVESAQHVNSANANVASRHVSAPSRTYATSHTNAAEHAPAARAPQPHPAPHPTATPHDNKQPEHHK